MWTCLLLRQFTHKVTSLLWVWRPRQWLSQNVMRALLRITPNIWYDHYSLNMTVHILLQWFLIYCLFWNSGSLASDVCWHQKWFSCCVSYLSSLTSLEKTLVSFLLVSGPNNYHGYNIINKNHLISMPRNSAFKFSIPNCNLEELPLWFPQKPLAK